MPALPDRWLSGKPRQIAGCQASPARSLAIGQPRQIAGRWAVCTGSRAGGGGAWGLRQIVDRRASSARSLAVELEVVCGEGAHDRITDRCAGDGHHSRCLHLQPFHSGPPEFATPSQRQQGTAERGKLPQTGPCGRGGGPGGWGGWVAAGLGSLVPQHTDLKMILLLH